MQIGPYLFSGRVVLAPMAGITDLPFRKLCRRFGAAFAVSEMVSANAQLYGSIKTQRKIDHRGEAKPRVVQIAGADPRAMALVARFNADNGADIIDINMGCPAKKICRQQAGSALLRDQSLVRKIIGAVVEACDLPITLKIRTGWDENSRNAVAVAKLAEEEGIAALAVHGRTRACGFHGQAEYETIREVKQGVSIPVIANGDIGTPAQAKRVLDFTGADAIMVGRGARGRPWLFQQINRFVEDGVMVDEPAIEFQYQIVAEHLQALYAFYGDTMGVRIARKHLAWYTKGLPGGSEFRRQINSETLSVEQSRKVKDFYQRQLADHILAA